MTYPNLEMKRRKEQGPNSVNSAQSSAEDRRRALWGPFKPLPNCSKFSIELNKYDELYEIFGISKRIKARLKFEPHTNKHLNDYFESQLRRMKQASDEEYWKIASWLLKYSNVFLMMALRHVKPRWHREMRFGEVRRILQKVKNLATNDVRSIEYYRVWIPKQKPGSFRPLGCPTLEWRIYLHMINQLIVLRAMQKGNFPSCQHGFYPSRGTLTAWKFILGSVINKQDIYEIDLRKFFDGVKLEKIRELLQRDGMSTEWTNRIADLNYSPVQPAKQFVGETKEQEEDRMKWTVHQIRAPGGSMVTLSMGAALTKMLRVGTGVPQGAPTSPFLSCMALEPLIEQTKSERYDPVTGSTSSRDLVGYADDWIIYGNNMDISYLYNNSSFKENGIEVSKDKSGWVRKDGVWLKPLKFLGLTYDGNADVLKASTRKGADLSFDKHRLVEALNSRDAKIADGQSFTLPDLVSEETTKPVSITKLSEYKRLYPRKSTGLDQPWSTPRPGDAWAYPVGYTTYYRVLRFTTYTVEVTNYDPRKQLNGPWAKFVQSSLVGFAQSRLYANSWNVKNYLQNFELSPIRGSWVDRRGSVSLDVFNSTSYAYSDLANILFGKHGHKKRKDIFDTSTGGNYWGSTLY